MWVSVEPTAGGASAEVDGIFDDPHGLKAVEEIGEDNITYESDYPHSDSTWPRTRQIAEEQMASLTDAQRRKIVRGNAIKLFGLDFVA